MHRDHKLGLALGVLVVGFAAALCFPKQTDVDQRLLQLENTAELDADIAELPVRAYTDADLLSPTRAPAAQTPAPEPASVFGPASLADAEGGFDLLAGPPAPINPGPVVEPETGDLDHELPPADVPALAQAGGPGDPAAEPTTAGALQYIVQPGDTLSSLAAVHLGNQGRYVELFAENREILATPDDLRPGMVLVIPGADAERELILPQDGPAAVDALPVISSVDTDSQATTPAAANAPASTERPRLFRPVRSQSFLKTQPVARETGESLPTLDASDSSRTLEDAAADDAQTYTVRPGDSLEAIAVRTYGDARRVDDLLKANRETVRDPRRLRPGMKLNVPPAP